MGSPIIEDVTGVLVAGGKSRRMGRDKRFLKVGGVSVFDRSLSLFQTIFAENLVALAEPVDGLEVQGCPVVYDVVKNAGSLGGLLTGLLASTRGRVFAIGCDMPFLDQDVIRFMCSCDSTADVVVARLEGRFHPMHAVYSKRCVPLLQAMAERRELKIHSLYVCKELKIRVLSDADFLHFRSKIRSFRNINTPDDLASAENSSSNGL
ncbi:MAG: molybdenum cofactor guanylyltransferase [Nitrospira sp.]|nr:molybdenum cofactor guanylyltransferase [Nitrospira sp.]MCW5788534.1 molybdenum cofactor guanylyltransferase [Nitrospira sp.]